MQSEFAESVINTIREPLIVLDQDLRVVTVSRSFYEFFKVKPEETVGQLIYDLGNKHWNIPKLRELLETILPQKTTFDNYEVEHNFATIGRRIMLLNARQIQGILGKERVILLAIEDITERKEIETGLGKAHEELKELAAKLTRSNIELTAVNKELETFSYSVAHDLRAPLRSIDGFSQILLEDYDDKLDDTGKDYLKRVRAASQRMAELIDDLLKLSKVTRYVMNHEEIDLVTLARNALQDLKITQPERQVEFIAADSIMVSGDKRLLSILAENLISNAWKFTSRHPHARIEVGVEERNGQKIYFVRDDGVGFDMNYADKLFDPFQRLHTETEFPGIGIGLATVQRIVHRHGGNIRAEGGVERGATFYFTLNNS